MHLAESVSASRAATSISGTAPLNPPEPWCIRMRALGRAKRFPFDPPARSTAPMLAPNPMQNVAMSGLIICMVS